MIWILVIILSHPSLTKPETFPMVVYKNTFETKDRCMEQAIIEFKKKSVMAAYCQEMQKQLVKK